MSVCIPRGSVGSRRSALKGLAPRMVFFLLLLGSLPALAAPPTCSLGQLAEVPVTMSGTKPIVHALVNGTDVAFVADSGAFFNTMTPAAAAQY